MCVFCNAASAAPELHLNYMPKVDSWQISVAWINGKSVCSRSLGERCLNLGVWLYPQRTRTKIFEGAKCQYMYLTSAAEQSLLLAPLGGLSVSVLTGPHFTNVSTRFHYRSTLLLRHFSLGNGLVLRWAFKCLGSLSLMIMFLLSCEE